MMPSDGGISCRVYNGRIKEVKLNRKYALNLKLDNHLLGTLELYWEADWAANSISVKNIPKIVASPWNMELNINNAFSEPVRGGGKKIRENDMIPPTIT